MEDFDLPDIEEVVEPTDEEEKQEREQLRLDMERQEADDERRWDGAQLSPPAKARTIETELYVKFTIAIEDHSPDQKRLKKCSDEREEYVTQRDRWIEWVVGPIHSKKKSRADRERLEAER